MAKKKSNQSGEDTQNIASIIKLHFNPPPAEKAAWDLFSMGVREKDISFKTLCNIPPFLPEPQVLAVSNALRDIERNHFPNRKPPTNVRNKK